MKSSPEKKYYAFLEQMQVMEKALGHVYLSDECIDAENCMDLGLDRDSGEFYEAMLDAAEGSIVGRLEDLFAEHKDYDTMLEAVYALVQKFK